MSSEHKHLLEGQLVLSPPGTKGGDRACQGQPLVLVLLWRTDEVPGTWGDTIFVQVAYYSREYDLMI